MSTLQELFAVSSSRHALAGSTIADDLLPRPVSILNEEKAWKPAITVKQILLGVQEVSAGPRLAVVDER